MGYTGSKYHLENMTKAGVKGNEKIQQLKEERIKKYNENPTRCCNCDGKIEYDKKRNKFCSKSCSATYNNKKRDGLKEETKRKISESLTGYKHSEETKSKLRGNTNGRGGGRGSCGVRIEPCKICGKLFTQRTWKYRLTCSKKCQIEASTKRKYQNGSRKTIYYKGVVLESSWELILAEWLDEKEIKWERPKPIGWVDDDNKQKLYYPDFYLTEYNLFLDPKNPYCMELDKDKMNKISGHINIIYGDIDYVIKEIEKLAGEV